MLFFYAVCVACAAFLFIVASLSLQLIRQAEKIAALQLEVFDLKHGRR